MASSRSALGEPMLHEVGNQSKMRIITRLSFFLGCAAVLTLFIKPFDEESTGTIAAGLWTIGRAGIPRISSVALQPRMPSPTSCELPRNVIAHWGYQDHPPKKKGVVPDHSHGGFWGAAEIPSAPTLAPGLEQLDALTEKFTVGGGQKGVVCLTNYIIAYRKNKRAGTASTKTRGEVSGGGRKPYKQKKTGRARRGSIRSPLIRGGGVIFGPKPRRYFQKVNIKEKKLAMARAFWEAAVTGVIEVVPDNFGVTTGKTSEGQAFFDAHKINTGPKKITPPGQKRPKGPKYFAIDSDFDELPDRGLRNLGDLEMKRAMALNAYDVVRADKIMITKRGLDTVLDRIGIAEDEEAEEENLVPA